MKNMLSGNILLKRAQPENNKRDACIVWHENLAAQRTLNSVDSNCYAH